jgi:hypothetical protein
LPDYGEGEHRVYVEFDGNEPEFIADLPSELDGIFLCHEHSEFIAELNVLLDESRVIDERMFKDLDSERP